MIIKNLSALNAQGRLQIPNDLLNFLNINNEEIAICKSSGDEELKLLPTKGELYDCEIIAVVMLDSKGRFVYPKRLRNADKNEKIFEIFIRNNELIIKEK